jgi:hypothetical protein
MRGPARAKQQKGAAIAADGPEEIDSNDQPGSPTRTKCFVFSSWSMRREPKAMLYGEPETSRFLVAVQRLKRQQRRKARQTRLAKQRVRAVLRKMRDS